jgi:hypothetical protein
MRRCLRHLPSALVASAVLFAAAVGVGALTRGPVGAAGAAAGVALVVASYVASSLAVAWADTVNPQLVMAVGLATYGVKFSLLGAGMLAVLATDWAGRVPMGLGVMAGVLVWTTAQVRWTWRARLPYVDLGEGVPGR